MITDITTKNSDTWELAVKIADWVSGLKIDGEHVLHAGICCDMTGRIPFIRGIEKIIKEHESGNGESHEN